MTEVIKGKALRQDLAQYDGITQTRQRKSSSGGYVQGLAIGDEVDVLMVHGQGLNRTQTVIQNCVNSLGSLNRSIKFSPGTWTIESNTTIPANLTSIIPAGCVFSVSTGITLTFSGPVKTDSDNFKTGAGTLTYTDDKMLQSVAGTNTITASTLSTLTALKNGQEFLFVPANNISGSATLNVNSTGAVNLRKNLSAGVTALVSGDMLASNVYRLTYVSTGPYYVVQNPEYPSIGGAEVTATGAELNKTDDSAAAVAGYTSVMRQYSNNEGGSATTFDFVTNVTEGTFETVGPTGSGATNIWTALDVLPTSARTIDVMVKTTINSSGADRNTQMHVWATGGDSVAATSDASIIQEYYIEIDDQSADDNRLVSPARIPLNASRVFRVTWQADNDDARTGVLFLKGFGV